MDRLPSMRPLLLATMLLTATRASAQDRATLRGAITDSASEAPVRRAYVWLGDQRGARADPNGHFVLDSIPPGVYRLRVACATGVWIQSRPLWEETLELVAGRPTVRAIVGDARGCDQRPFATRTGRYRGFYESGFEHSRFVPCATSAAGLPPTLAALRGDSIWVWAEFRAGAVTPPWPAAAEHPGFRRWYIEWRGTIRGPDRYGHMSVAEYQAEIDTVLALRRPSRRDCRP